MRAKTSARPAVPATRRRYLAFSSQPHQHGRLLQPGCPPAQADKMGGIGVLGQDQDVEASTSHWRVGFLNAMPRKVEGFHERSDSISITGDQQHICCHTLAQTFVQAAWNVKPRQSLGKECKGWATCYSQSARAASI